MDVIHLTQGAADPMMAFDATGVRFLPLADGHGQSHLSCAHLEPGAILLIVEADELAAHSRGSSSPERIAGQTWPAIH